MRELDEYDRRRFNPSDLDHELTKRYNLSCIGRGGQKVVYAVKSHPNLVAGVWVSTILDSFRKAGLGEDSSVLEKEYKTLLEQERERMIKMRECFDRDKTLKQRSCCIYVPINKRLMLELISSFSGHEIRQNDVQFDAGTKEVLAIVSIQEKSPELSDSSRIPVVSGYAERILSNDPELFEAYDWITTAFVISPYPGAFTPIDEIIKIHPGLEKLLLKAKESQDLALQIKDFIEKSIRYADENHEILDLAGADNLIFYTDQKGRWSYKLIDAMYPTSPSPEGKIAEAGKIIKKITEAGRTSLTEKEKKVLINALNYVRVINILAERFGVKERINIIPDGTSVSAQDLRIALEDRQKDLVDRLVEYLFEGIKVDQISSQVVCDKFRQLGLYYPDKHPAFWEEVMKRESWDRWQMTLLLSGLS